LIGLLAAPAALQAAVRRRRIGRQGALPSQLRVRALGEAILPGELGKVRQDVASDAFWRWLSGYREDAELLHPYGSPRIGFTGASPVPRWAKQLSDLDGAARAQFGTPFTALSVSRRQDLVREALAAFPSARLDEVAAAPHIALGLLSHFYGSSEATDLCYRAQIGRHKCRPLVHNERKPLPIATS
jgi:hypothetical protein